MSCFRGPLVIMKCKNNLQCTFLVGYRHIWLIPPKKEPKLLLLEIISGWGISKKEHTRERKSPSFVSGLNQRLTEICLDRSKLFSMGNMWPPKWQRAMREVKRYPLLLLRGATRSTKNLQDSFCLCYKWISVGWKVKVIITYINTSILPSTASESILLNPTVWSR